MSYASSKLPLKILFNCMATGKYVCMYNLIIIGFDFFLSTLIFSAVRTIHTYLFLLCVPVLFAYNAKVLIHDSKSVA